MNQQWNPRGEEYLWSPSMQVPKSSKKEVLVYDYDLRRREIEWFKSNLNKYLPYCHLRYSF
jgi:spore photoproduct lyase